MSDSKTIIPISWPHAEVTATDYADESDRHAEIVREQTWQLHPAASRLELGANLVTVLDPGTGEGLVWLRLAPSAAVRTWDAAEPNLVIERHEGAWRAIPGATVLNHPWRVVPFSGGFFGRTRALHALQRELHPPQAGRDGVFLSNTWGDRGRADRMSEAFLLAEIDQAAEIGVEVVQIDDGWQTGRTANTVAEGGVWNDFWATAADFWTPDRERFPNGLEPVVQHARERGVRLGLWYAPDSSGECANWERDAAMLVELASRHGIRHFKLDGVKLLTPACVERFHALLDRVVETVGPDILFDLDTTAESRLGFWGRPAGSAIFVENRYTDWGTWFPHSTLRVLWSLAATVLPLRLRMEVLNPARNPDRYGTDLLAPGAYPPASLFAAVMLASPLGWFENSGLPDGFKAALAPLVRLWKAHRATLHGGAVVPVGGKPNGHVWTGFAVVDEAGGLVHLLVFRELHPREEAVLELPPGCARKSRGLTVVAGEGAGELRVRDGRVEAVCQLPRRQDFLWLQAD
ncbi:MAG: hypothetical protein EA425_02040 [Puniceicoccaceae bacterium]|nr:MAG: hypothetical protein EA425_02040 [Puniceicoccaceae bacterium]